MIHSMTAFARAEQASANGTLSWELRSVNHRYLEPHLRLPESFRDLEGAVREALRNGLSRGKVECTLRFSDDNAGKALQVNLERAAQLVAAAESVAGLIKQPAALNPLEVLGWPGVLVADAADPQALNQSALSLFTEALNELKNGREREGSELAKLLNERLDSILEQVVALRELVPQMLAGQRQKILDRCAEMQAELDPQRLEQELGFAYIIRFKGNILVGYSGGEQVPARDWLTPTGRTRTLKAVELTGQRQPVERVYCCHKSGMKDAWFLASNRTDLSAAKALQLYGQRWGIETSFRDIKDYKFGMGMGDVHISNPVRRDRLFLFSALAIVLLTLLGKAGDSVGLERTIKVNTSKSRTYSFFRQGVIYYQLLPKMKEANAVLLMDKFIYYLKQHRLYTRTLGII